MNHLDIPDYFSSLTKAAFHVAFKAGELLRDGFSTDFIVSPKQMKNDVVTQYDHLSEKLIVTMLKEQFPTHSFLCEESGFIQTVEENPTINWIIDPLDGTVNFAHHIPIFCVSIAAVNHEEILCGAIYAPLLGEMFVAEKNGGAFLNGKPLKVSSQTSINSALMGTSLSFNLYKNNSSKKSLERVVKLESPWRALGSAALNLAYVSAGRFDAYWSPGGALNPWDVATGKLLVEEAGGMVTQSKGEKYMLSKESTILASNGTLHADLVHYLNS